MTGPAIGAYIAPGKRAFRQLLFDLATHDGVTSYATFWGHGIDSRMFAPHFDVVACEIREAKHAAMVEDGLAHSYRTHTGRGATLPENVDMFHADFDGPPSQTSFDELRRISTKTTKWLAVTLSNAHKLDPAVQGEAASYTIPAWLTGASGFTLEYLARYASTGGQTMWVAILQRREGKGNHHQVLPVQIARSIALRRYWASGPMYETGLMPHVLRPKGTPRQAASIREKRHAVLREFTVECSECGTEFVLNRIMKPGRRPKFCSDSCRTVGRKRSHDRHYKANRDLILAGLRDWRQANLRPKKCRCLECGKDWLHPPVKGRVPKYCGPVCVRAARTEAQRTRRAAAVSGTAAKAVSNSVANQEKAA